MMLNASADRLDASMGSRDDACEAKSDDDHSSTQQIVAALLRCLGVPEHNGTIKTPARVATALHFLTSGYAGTIEDTVGDAIYEWTSGHTVVSVKRIHFYSLCEHHLLPFFGTCDVSYVPDAHVIGLSKIPRLVDMFARRLQMQERLTAEISDGLTRCLRPRGIVVEIRAQHLCVCMRGTQKSGSVTVTNVSTGCLLSDTTSELQVRRRSDSL
jgi:GTP cyclohydrolase I